MSEHEQIIVFTLQEVDRAVNNIARAVCLCCANMGQTFLPLLLALDVTSPVG